MNRLSSPMIVVPCPVIVPRWIVQNSRKVLRLPIVRVVGSPLYLRSWGGPPSAAWGGTRLSSPSVVGPSITAWAPPVVWGPLVTRAPTIGLWPISAVSLTDAEGWALG